MPKRIKLVFSMRVATEDRHFVLDVSADPPTERKAFPEKNWKF